MLFFKALFTVVSSTIILTSSGAAEQDNSYGYSNSHYNLTKITKGSIAAPDRITVEEQNGMLSLSGLFSQNGVEIKFTKGIKLPEARGQIGIDLLVESEDKHEATMFNPTDSINVFFLISDSQGKKWTFNSNYDAWSARSVPFNTWAVVESYPLEARDNRGLPGAVGRPANSDLPVAPLTLEGFLFKPRKALNCRIFIKNIFQENIDRNEAAIYWSLGNRYLCAGLPGAAKPFLYFTDLAESPGKYCFDWIVKDCTTEKPVASGTKEFSVKQQSYPTGNKLIFPGLPEGTYRLSGKLYLKDKITANGFPLANDVKKIDEWFFIFRNTSPEKTAFADAVKYIPMVQIAPNKYPGTFEAAELKNGIKVLVRINAPAEKSILRLKWNLYDGEAIPAANQKIDLPGKKKVIVSANLPEYKDEKAYYLTASLFDSQNRLIEEKTRLFGIRGGDKDKPDYSALRELPESHPSYHVGLTGIGPKFRGIERFKSNVEKLRKFGIKAVELHIDWAFLEPLPGVWTFRELDQIVDISYKAGMKITLRFRNDFMRYTIPDWLPADYLSQQNGIVDGIISCGPAFSPCNKNWRNACENFFSVIAKRYGNHPAVSCYKLVHNMREAHWVDRPFKYQYTDYSYSTTEAFREYLLRTYGSITKLNAAWKTSYKNWSEIKPPQPFWGTGRIDTRLCWADFMNFKSEVFNNHLFAMLDSIREFDKKNKICVYTINGLTGPIHQAVLNRMKNDNVEFSTGGAIPQGTIGYTRLYSALHGIHVEPEPNSYSLRDADMVDDHAGMMLEGAAGRKPSFFFYWPTTLDPMDESQKDKSIVRRLQDWENALNQAGAISLPPLNLGIAFSLESLGAVSRSYYRNSILSDINRFYDKLNHIGIMAQGIDDLVPLSAFTPLDVIWAPATGGEVMSTDLRKNLVTYAKNGGFLVVSAHTAVRQPVIECTVDRDKTIIRNDSTSLMNELGFKTKGAEGKNNAVVFPDIAGRPKLIIFRPVAIAEKTGDKILARFKNGNAAIVQRKFGKGTVLMVGGELHYGSGDAFLKVLEDIYLKHGGKRWIWTDNPSLRIVVTPHFAKDGTFYAYVLNNTGKNTDVKLSFGNCPPNINVSTALKITDLLNKVKYNSKSYSELQKNGMSIQLSAERAAFIQFSPVK